ncbi:hypothetical protein D3C78_1097100 [compost metagenome]
MDKRGGNPVKVSRFLMAAGIPLAIIFGLPGIIISESPAYYKYVGLLGVILVGAALFMMRQRRL